MDKIENFPKRFDGRLKLIKESFKDMRYRFEKAAKYKSYRLDSIAKVLRDSIFELQPELKQVVFTLH